MVENFSLRCIRGPLNAESFELDPQFRYILGREPETEDPNTQKIQLESKTVSRTHAEVFFESGSWQIRDLESYNGIRVERMKVLEAYLQVGSQIEIGEFKFVLVGQVLEETNIESKAISNTKPKEPTAKGQSESRWHYKVLIQKFNRLDFRYRLMSLLSALLILTYFVLRVPVMIQVERDLLDQTYSYAIQTGVLLAEKNRRELADRSFYLLDCDYLLSSSVVRSASLWDRQVQQVCPVGVSNEPDYLLSLAQDRQELVSDCDSSVGVDNIQTCSVVVPVKHWISEEAAFATVGFARLDYYASDVVAAVSNIRSLFNRAFLLILLFGAGVWWLVHRWVRSAAKVLEDEVHLLFTGTAQKVEHLQSFAALNELVDELNSLFLKLNQDVKSDASAAGPEASFLQNLLQQVFLLEERAVLAVDHENQVLAVSPYLPEVIPVHEDATNLHISEAVVDTHLQGELMSFLNDISQADEVLERSLSMSDRVVAAHGMPIYFKDEHVASLILF